MTGRPLIITVYSTDVFLTVSRTPAHTAGYCAKWELLTQLSRYVHLQGNLDYAKRQNLKKPTDDRGKKCIKYKTGKVTDRGKTERKRRKKTEEKIDKTGKATKERGLIFTSVQVCCDRS
jgi:hypothetical protein